MHAGIVFRQIVDEHDLDHVTNFGSQDRTIDTVGGRLLGRCLESRVSVSLVHSLLPGHAPVGTERSSDVEVASCRSVRR